MRDWRHDAEQYRDLDRAAQERAESVADLPDAEVLAEAREAGEDTAAVAARVQTAIRRAAGAMASPTPGPWESPGTDGGERVVICHNRDGKRRTLAHVYGRTNAERDANARLIALAPRMAEALRALDSPGEPTTDLFLETRAILRELDGGARLARGGA